LENLALPIALLNFLIACGRLYFCVRKKRMITIAWFLIAYFSFFFIPVSLTPEFTHVLGFTNRSVPIEYSRIESTCAFVLLFNLIFLATEIGLWRIFGVSTANNHWQLPRNSPRLSRISLCYLVLLVVGSVLYGIQTLEFDYTDYVENKASWSMVFLWASTPFITISAMRRQYARALLACVPFLYFAFAMKIRSFALLSLIPVAVIYALQVTAGRRLSLAKLARFGLYGGALGLILIMSSALILSNKIGTKGKSFAMPDSGMPFGTAIMMELSDKFDVKTGSDALVLYGRNLINPFTKVYEKLSDEKLEWVEDPPFVMGRLYEGAPDNWRAGFHYPALWYADAYVAFGQAGLLLAALWAAIFVFWEAFMSTRMLVFALMLPFF
jgi:hypothetical protein